MAEQFKNILKENFLKYVFMFLILFQNFLSADEAVPSTYEKTVLVTGGAGFIGSNFVEYMYDRYPNYRFIVLDALTYAGSLKNIPSRIQDSERFEFVHGSITDEPLVDTLMGTANFVVHFAAETHVTRSILDDFAFFKTDVMGTRALMCSLVKHAKTVERFVHISTSEVYGTAEYRPINEDHPVKPRSPYAAAKAGADKLVYAYGKTYDIPVVTLRPFNNFGPRQHPEKMIAHFVTSAIQNKPLTVHGTGAQTRDWLYTLDLADAIDKALHVDDFSKVKNEEINIGSGRDISVLQIAKTIMEQFGLQESFLVFEEDRPGQVQVHISSTEKAERLLGWKPSTSFEEGLKKTIDWYKSNELSWQEAKEHAVVSLNQKVEGNAKCVD